jgi:hypothetical protein
LAFFGGGQTSGNQSSKVVDIFNSISQTWSTSTLSQARIYFSATSIGEIVAFGGGWNGLTYSSVVDMYNVTSNTWFNTNLSQACSYTAASSSTNKILFGGGFNGTYLNIVDIFEIPLSLLLPSPASISSLQSPGLQPSILQPFSSVLMSAPTVLTTFPNMITPSLIPTSSIVSSTNSTSMFLAFYFITY